MTDNKGTDSVDLSESAFKPGMVVNVKGVISDDLNHRGVATEVELEDNLEGPVDITPTNGVPQFQALGQTVALNTTAATIASGKTRLAGFGNFSTAAQIVHSSPPCFRPVPGLRSTDSPMQMASFRRISSPRKVIRLSLPLPSSR